MGNDKDELEEVRRLAQENRKSVERMTEEIQRLKKRLERKDQDRAEGSPSGNKSKAS